MYEWSEEGPVYGPNGQLELDPDNQQCWQAYGSEETGARAVLSTCKNNCPGGEPLLIIYFIMINCMSLFS